MLTNADFLSPLAIFLVKRGGNGDRVLFRYPFLEPIKKKKSADIVNGGKSAENGTNSAAEGATNGNVRPSKPKKKKNPYALPEISLEDLAITTSKSSKSSKSKEIGHGPGSNPGASENKKKLAEAEADEEEDDMQHFRLNEQTLPAFQSKHLSNLFAVPKDLCERKFELKIDDVRFVGFPCSLEILDEDKYKWGRYWLKKEKPDSNLSMLSVVFALHARADFTQVQCYSVISMMLGKGIAYEQHRVTYLTEQASILINAQDEIGSIPPEQRTESPFALALRRSTLARSLKKAFDGITEKGECDVSINGWPHAHYCIPQKAYHRLNPHTWVTPKMVADMRMKIFPYHSLLLLHHPQSIIGSFPSDYNTAYKLLCQQASPRKSLRDLALDIGVTLSFVLEMACNLVHWAKATIIFPVCQTNEYDINPDLEDPFEQSLEERFQECFPGERLSQYLAFFSQHNSIQQIWNYATYEKSEAHLTAVVVWLVKNLVIVQKYDYYFLFIREDRPTNLPCPHKSKKQKKSLTERLRTEHVPGESFDAIFDKACAEGFGRQSVNKNATEEELLARFSPEEQEIIKKVNYELEELNLFCRCAPYFNGENHVEAIRYHENVSREAIENMVHIFNSVVLKFEYEDEALKHHFKYLKDIGKEARENDSVGFPVLEDPDFRPLNGGIRIYHHGSIEYDSD